MAWLAPSLRAWRDRDREPGLSVLLALELLVLFVVMALDEIGILISWITDTAIVLAILAGAASWMRGLSPTVLSISLRFLAILTYIATLMIVVGSAVFAPGRITVHRVQGAVVLFVKLAMFFACAARLLAILSPGSYSPESGPGAIMEGTRAIYFSIVTLTSTGYGDIVPVHPIARALANLEALIGQLFPATLLARLVTMELATRER